MSAATDLFTAVAGDSVFVQALAGGAVIAGVNLLGASLVLLVRDPSERFLDGTLGFGNAANAVAAERTAALADALALTLAIGI
jgi:ZIP family zinc transporter